MHCCILFIYAYTEAMAANKNFTTTKTIFKDAITESLRASKQRLRNRQHDGPGRVAVVNSSDNSRRHNQNSDSDLTNKSES